MSITLSGSNVSRFISHKLLGAMSDETLEFDVHINKVCTKVSEPLGVIRRVSNRMPDNVFSSFTIVLYIHAYHMQFVPSDLLIQLNQKA